MHLEELFTELPYASALYNDFLSVRCSTCFAADAKATCKDGCGVIVYCNEICREIDQKNHEYECAALKKSTQLSSFVRLLARILSRRLVDGGVAHLSENFPKNIPDRSFDVLISHHKEISASSSRAESMMWSWTMFSEAFQGTRIMSTCEDITRVYCVALINCFSVSGPPNVKKGHDEALGLGFYLNTSRFNHGCRPDLFISFEGARLIADFPCDADDEHGIAAARLSLTKSPEAFNGLTLNYGYSNSFTTDNFFPIRSQRRASLNYAYYFTCQCALCKDDREANLEERAAALECSHCAEPCLWKKVSRPTILCCTSPIDSTFVCHKSCKCSWNATDQGDAKTYAQSLNPGIELKSLEEEFRSAMRSPINDTAASDIVITCEPVLMKARYFWHRSGNLRMAQLNERLFAAYGSLAVGDWRANKNVDRYILKAALETGEGVLSYFDKHHLNDAYYTVMAAYAFRLARLYVISAILNTSYQHAKKAEIWYLRAASIWEMRPGKNGSVLAQLHAWWKEEAKNVDTVFKETEDKKTVNV